MPRNEIILSMVLIGVMEMVHLVQRRIDFRVVLNDQKVWFRWAVYYVAVGCILALGAYNNSSQFIYFQF